MKFIFLLFFGVSLYGQDIIEIKNGSFEEVDEIKTIKKVRINKVIYYPEPMKFNQLHNHNSKVKYWHYDNTYSDESPPDLFVSKNHYGSNITANDGINYIGIVTRDNGTFEGVYQKLSRRLIPNKTHTINLDIAKGEKFIANTKSSGLTDFKTPAILKLYGFYDDISEKQLLYTSHPINLIGWVNIRICFTPTEPFEHLLFEANYNKDSLYLEPYFGHLLIDNISNILINKDENIDTLAFGVYKSLRKKPKYFYSVSDGYISQLNHFIELAEKSASTNFFDCIDKLSKKDKVDLLYLLSFSSRFQDIKTSIKDIIRLDETGEFYETKREELKHKQGSIFISIIAANEIAKSFISAHQKEIIRELTTGFENCQIRS